MEIILVAIVYIIISLVFICLCKKFEKNCKTYDTNFCRDVRANLGMFAYPSDIEAAREKLNSKKSKF